MTVKPIREPMVTTLNSIRSFHPCEEGWTKLLANLGKTSADDEPLLLTKVHESNDLDDAIWVACTLTGEQRIEFKRFLCFLMDRAAEHVSDPESSGYHIVRKLCRATVGGEDCHVELEIMRKSIEEIKTQMRVEMRSDAKALRKYVSALLILIDTVTADVAQPLAFHRAASLFDLLADVPDDFAQEHLELNALFHQWAEGTLAT